MPYTAIYRSGKYAPGVVTCNIKCICFRGIPIVSIQAGTEAAALRGQAGTTRLQGPTGVVDSLEGKAAAVFMLQHS